MTIPHLIDILFSALCCCVAIICTAMQLPHLLAYSSDLWDEGYTTSAFAFGLLLLLCVAAIFFFLYQIKMIV